MLRTAIAATATICALGLIGAPAAAAAPRSTESSHANNAGPTASNNSPGILRPRHTAGRPAGDWRAARQRVMDRYFSELVQKRLG